VEILKGLRSAERVHTEALFRTLSWIGVDEPIARRAGELGRLYRRSHSGIGTPDLIIAATVQEVGLALATINVRDFPMFKGLRAPYRG
jgi:predicted nucleic acid-binding protein